MSSYFFHNKRTSNVNVSPYSRAVMTHVGAKNPDTEEDIEASATVS